MIRAGRALGAALVVASLAGPLAAQTQDQGARRSAPTAVELQLHPTLLRLQELQLDPSIRSGWAPCEVVVTNHGFERRLELRLGVSLSGHPLLTRRRQVQLASGQSRRVWFLIPVRRGDLRLDLQAVEIGESGAEGRALGGVSSSLQVDETRGYYTRVPLVRVLFVEPGGPDAPTPVGLRQLGQRRGWNGQRVLVGVRPPDSLPDSAFAYDGVDLLVLHAVDLTQLLRPQLDAIQGWVATGGRLLLIPGETTAWFDQQPLRELIGTPAVRARGARQLQELEWVYRQLPALPGPFPFYELPVTAKTSVVNAARWDVDTLPAVHLQRAGPVLPFAYRFGRGLGLVYLLAFDPFGPGLNKWSGALPFFDSVLEWTDVNRAPRWRTRHDLQEDPLERPAVTGPLDSRRRPSPVFALGLVLAYVLVVGPLNFWWLGRRRARERLVLTVPLIALVFTLGVFGFGYAVGGLSTVWWRADVVRGRFGERWVWERSGVSVLSPSPGRHQVELDSGLAATRVLPRYQSGNAFPFSATCGDALRFPRVDLERWTLAYFEGQRVLDLQGGIRLDGSGPALRLDNASSLRVARGLLFWAGDEEQPYWVDELGPGASQTLGRRLSKLRPRQPRPGHASGDAGYGRLEMAQRLFPDDLRGQECCLKLMESFRLPAPNQESRVLFVGVLAEPASQAMVDGRERPDRQVSLLVLDRAP